MGETRDDKLTCECPHSRAHSKWNSFLRLIADSILFIAFLGTSPVAAVAPFRIGPILLWRFVNLSSSLLPFTLARLRTLARSHGQQKLKTIFPINVIIEANERKRARKNRMILIIENAHSTFSLPLYFFLFASWVGRGARVSAVSFSEAAKIGQSEPFAEYLM